MSIRRLLLPFLLLVAAAGPGRAHGAEPCSIRPPKATKKTDLPAMARITKAQAQATALASLPAGSKATVKEAELEVERGCLVFSFDIRIAGRAGVQEVQVDAGNGKVLSSEHESPKQEAAEAAKDQPA